MKNRKRMSKKELKVWLFILVINLFWILPCVWDYTHRKPIEEVVEESETELIKWKDTEVTEEELIIEDIETDVVTEPQEEVSNNEGIKFYNVPLSEELQMHTFYECDGYNIAPSLVFAIMWRESRFQESAVSPYGAIGLMQVAPKWHWDRMERLGCNDLYNPYQNITVGIDYLAYLKEQNRDIVWVLTAYRWGESKANENHANWIVCEYAKEVIEKASEIAREVE